VAFVLHLPSVFIWYSWHNVIPNCFRTMTQQQSNQEFVNDLFDKLFKHTDTDMIDLQDDDTCCDHLEFEQLSLDF